MFPALKSIIRKYLNAQKHAGVLKRATLSATVLATKSTMYNAYVIDIRKTDANRQETSLIPRQSACMGCHGETRKNGGWDIRIGEFLVLC